MKRLLIYFILILVATAITICFYLTILDIYFEIIKILFKTDGKFNNLSFWNKYIYIIGSIAISCLIYSISSKYVFKPLTKFFEELFKINKHE